MTLHFLDRHPVYLSTTRSDVTITKRNFQIGPVLPFKGCRSLKNGVAKYYIMLFYFFVAPSVCWSASGAVCRLKIRRLVAAMLVAVTCLPAEAPLPATAAPWETYRVASSSQFYHQTSARCDSNPKFCVFSFHLVIYSAKISNAPQEMQISKLKILL